MRLSSVIVFATLALLASTSPIDRSNSLWRRTGPPPDPRTVKVIDKDAVENGVRVSCLTFHDGQSHVFQYTPTLPWATQQHGSTGQHTRYTFDDITYIQGFASRTYKEYGRPLLLLLVSGVNSEFQVFYTPWEEPNGQLQHTEYTTRQSLSTNGEFIQSFYAPDGRTVLTFRRSSNGAWHMSYPGPIQWRTSAQLQNIPHQH